VVELRAEALNEPQKERKDRKGKALSSLSQNERLSHTVQEKLVQSQVLRSYLRK